MADTSTINANVAECLKSMSHWGFSRVHNVCTGTVADVPWGAVDWILGALVSAVMLGAAILLIGLGTMMVRDS